MNIIFVSRKNDILMEKVWCIQEYINKFVYQTLSQAYRYQTEYWSVSPGKLVANIANAMHNATKNRKNISPYQPCATQQNGLFKPNWRNTHRNSESCLPSSVVSDTNTRHNSKRQRKQTNSWRLHRRCQGFRPNTNTYYWRILKIYGRRITIKEFLLSVGKIIINTNSQHCLETMPPEK